MHPALPPAPGNRTQHPRTENGRAVLDGNRVSHYRLAALIFSIVSFSRQQDRADKQQARAEKLTVDSVKPLLWIQGQNYIDLKSVQLRNHGLGPAIIKLARFDKKRKLHGESSRAILEDQGRVGHVR